jgi:hypothetical protein
MGFVSYRNGFKEIVECFNNILILNNILIPQVMHRLFEAYLEKCEWLNYGCCTAKKRPKSAQFQHFLANGYDSTSWSNKLAESCNIHKQIQVIHKVLTAVYCLSSPVFVTVIPGPLPDDSN